MKVKELIEMLQKLNPEALVIPEPKEGMNLKEIYSFDENKWNKEDIDNKQV